MLEWTGYLNRVARWPGGSPTTENTGTPGKLSPKTVETQHSCQKLPGRASKPSRKLANCKLFQLNISSRAAAEILLDAELTGAGR